MLIGAFVERVAERRDVLRKRRIFDGNVAPHAAEQLIFIKDAPAVFDQRREDFKCLGRQGNERAVAPEQAFPAVGRERPEGVAAAGGSKIGVHSRPRRNRAERGYSTEFQKSSQLFKRRARLHSRRRDMVRPDLAVREGAMSRNTFACRLAIALGTWFIAVPAFAQLTTGTVTGTIKDSQSGV